MFGISETVTRTIWAEGPKDSCLINDPIVGNHFKPSCSARTKNAEGPWITYRYNECGYRSATSCGTKPPGAVRIAILGASVSEGLYVPYEQTYFARTSRELSRMCNRSVDVQNFGVEETSPIQVYRRVQEALALKPDVVLYLLTPFDLERQIDPKELSERNAPPQTHSTKAVRLNESALKRLQRMVTESRTMLVAQHVLFQNKDVFLRLYLLYGDKADYLRQPLTRAWQKRFADLDLIIGDMAGKLRASGVPLVIMPVPSRAEAAVMSSRQLPPHMDPFAFGREIENIASKHGADYVDLMQAFGRIPDAESLFYVVDGHVTGDGEKVIAQNLSAKLRDGNIQAFSNCAPGPAVAMEH